MSLPILTNSSTRAFRRCPRLYRHRYVDLLEANGESAQPLRFGSAFHAGLEAWWGMAGEQAMFAAARDAIDGSGLDEFDAATASALMTGYHLRWMREPLRVVTVEREFRRPILNPETGAASRTYDLSGKVDSVAIDEHGDGWLVEHKTTSRDVSVGSPYWQALAMDSQVSLYMDAIGSELGIELVGCLYDVIRKPTIKPAKATPEDKRKFTKAGKLYAGQRDRDETPAEWFSRLAEDIAERPDFYFVRGKIARTESDLREARFDLWQTAKMIRESEKLDRWPRNPDACWHFGRPCDFWEACTGQASLDDSRKFVKREKAHSELSEETSHAAAE